VGGGSESQYTQCGTEDEGTQPLVQNSAALAHGSCRLLLLGSEGEKALPARGGR